MSQRNDKILLVAAGLLLAGSAAFSLFGLRASPDSGPQVASQGAPPSGKEYPVLAKEQSLPLRANWTRPEDNEDGWTYDLFDQVPTVWDDQLKEYLPRDYTPPVIPDFGVKLVRLGHPRYPYMLRSTFAPPPGKPEADRILLLVNLDTNEDYNARIGKPIAGAGITPLSFRVVSALGPDGAPAKRNVLTVRDSNLGRDIEIDDQAPVLFKDRVDIVLQSDNGAVNWTFNKEGAKFDHNGAAYALKGFDLAAGTVTVDKTFTLNPRKGPRTLTEVLTLAPPAPKEKTPPAKPAAAPSPSPATPSPTPLTPR